jgi:hypothetical protein
MIGVMSSAPLPTPHDIETAEQQLGAIRFPEDYRRWLLEHNGVEGWYGEVFLVLYSVADVVSVTRAAEAEERLPGVVVIGSDGSREVVALDFRSSTPPVVLLDITAEGWDDVLPQAASFSEFMDQRRRGEPFRWGQSGE